VADRYDPDERFSLHPRRAEDVLRRMLDADEEPPDEDDEAVEDDPPEA
jgi:hypothetical protein